MELILKNVGIIENASIEINGLTVIAGDNDTGKSTIGKIAYSLTKSYEDFEIIYERDKLNAIRKQLREFYVTLRRDVNFIKYPEIRELMDRYRHFSRVDLKKSIEILIDLRNIATKGKIAFNKNTINWINEFVENIENAYRKQEPKDTKIIKSIKKVFTSEFQNQINNLFSDESRISALEGKNEIISLIIRENRIIQDKNKKMDEIFPFESSVFIETPFILMYKESLEFGSDIYHINDLLKKLETPFLVNEERKLDISKIINGEVYYDEEEDNFLYRKKTRGKNIKINILNSASGIRSFGILQLLDNSGEFNKNILLVIDEPEVHLHPDWQVEYAMLLVNLVKSGVNILITSHSPYLIEAINKYSKKEKIEGKTKFYLSELKENGKAIISDKTNEKDIIFDKLSKPFERLVFGD